MKNFPTLNQLYLYWILILLIPQVVQSQDIEAKINEIKGKVEEPFKITGGISAATNFNFTNGIDARTTPFSFRLHGNMNVSWKGISIPINLNYSNGATVFNYQLPSYSLVGLTPSYKWAKFHFGDSSMEFSPYTLSGHSFRGGGVELTPGNFRFSVMYGRLRQANENDLESLQNLDPSYKRIGYGFKAGYEKEGESLAFIFFRAWDEAESNLLIADSLGVLPGDNLVLGLQFKKRLGKIISLSVDGARSAYTRDNRGPRSEDTVFDGFLKSYGGLFKPKNSTGYHHALKTSIDFQTKIGTFNLLREWVGPGYQTMGTLFFNNDLENYTLGGNTTFFNKKVRLSSNIGVQRNDLKNTRASSNNRFIGSINMSVSLSKKSNLNVSYSNFRTTNKLRAVSVPFVVVDSIVLSQVNQNINFNFNQTIGAKSNSVLNFLFSFQNATSIQNDQLITEQQNKNYLFNTSYAYTIPALKLALGASLMTTYNILPQSELLSVAPSLSLAKPFFEDKLRASLSMAYTSIYDKGDLINGVYTVRTNLQFTFFEKHNLAFTSGLIYRNQNSSQLNTTSFTDFNGGLTYSWRF